MELSGAFSVVFLFMIEFQMKRKVTLSIQSDDESVMCSSYIIETGRQLCVLSLVRGEIESFTR